MVAHRLTAEIPEADYLSIMDSIAAIKAKLPFLLGLTATESQSFSKLGPKNIDFTTKCMEVALQNRKAIPPELDLDEMQRDLKLYEDLRKISFALSQLQSLIHTTTMQAGGEAHEAARSIYTYLKASKSENALKQLTDLLGENYAHKSRRSTGKKKKENDVSDEK